jgi:hypothetical protein
MSQKDKKKKKPLSDKVKKAIVEARFEALRDKKIITK